MGYEQPSSEVSNAPRLAAKLLEFSGGFVQRYKGSGPFSTTPKKSTSIFNLEVDWDQFCGGDKKSTLTHFGLQYRFGHKRLNVFP